MFSPSEQYLQVRGVRQNDPRLTFRESSPVPGRCRAVGEAAGLLAMQCMVRGESTSDYVVMVQAEDEILEGLTEKANKLLEAGKSVGSQVKLTRREDEVLSGLMKSLANKEIAVSLNLS